MLNDLTGKTFGKLTVVEMAPRTQKKTYWVCKCECGGEKTVRSDALVGGMTKSCGCLKKEQDKINLDRYTHRKSKTRLYNIWQLMLRRCEYEGEVAYDRYGGRGIKVCEEWGRGKFESFEKWALSNGYNDTLSIDRIDNDGDYEPSNCRWVDEKEQANNRRSNIKITIDGESKNLKEWCQIFGLNYGTINSKRQRGIPVDSLFPEEVLKKYRNA